jgi:hypothetical protein
MSDTCVWPRPFLPMTGMTRGGTYLRGSAPRPVNNPRRHDAVVADGGKYTAVTARRVGPQWQQRPVSADIGKRGPDGPQQRLYAGTHATPACPIAVFPLAVSCRVPGMRRHVNVVPSPQPQRLQRFGQHVHLAAPGRPGGSRCRRRRLARCGAVHVVQI